jgi:glycerol kinase
MTANGWLCQFLADIVEVPVDRPANLETTALGAAFHAGMATGVWSGLDELARTWEAADTFRPKMDGKLRQTLLAGWEKAVAKTLSRP